MKDQLIRECFKQFYSVAECVLECSLYGVTVTTGEVLRAYKSFEITLSEQEDAGELLDLVAYV